MAYARQIRQFDLGTRANHSSWHHALALNAVTAVDTGMRCCSCILVACTGVVIDRVLDRACLVIATLRLSMLSFFWVVLSTKPTAARLLLRFCQAVRPALQTPPLATPPPKPPPTLHTPPRPLPTRSQTSARCLQQRQPTSTTRCKGRTACAARCSRRRRTRCWLLPWSGTARWSEPTSRCRSAAARPLPQACACLESSAPLRRAPSAAMRPRGCSGESCLPLACALTRTSRHWSTRWRRLRRCCLTSSGAQASRLRGRGRLPSLRRLPAAHRRSGWYRAPRQKRPAL